MKFLWLVLILLALAGCATTQASQPVAQQQFKYIDLGPIPAAIESKAKPGEYEIEVQRKLHWVLRSDGQVMWALKQESPPTPQPAANKPVEQPTEESE